MLLYQPANHVSVRRIKFVAKTKRSSIHGAELRMVATSALADVVIKPGDIQQLRFWQVVNAVMCKGRLCLSLGITKAAHIADHHHGVCIHRIDMEQVVLHLPNYLPEFWDVTCEHAVTTHACELGDDFVRRLEQTHEELGVFWVLPVIFIDQIQRLAY